MMCGGSELNGCKSFYFHSKLANFAKEKSFQVAFGARLLLLLLLMNSLNRD